MRLGLLGAIEFTDHCLEAVLGVGREHLAAVLTLPPARQARLHSESCRVTQIAQAAGVPVREVDDLNDPQGLALLRSLELDHLLVMGWSRLLSAAALATVRGLVIGSHPAPLPRGRGRHPIIWPLVLGWNASALTLLRLGEGPPDSGPILWQRGFAIAPQDTATAVYARVCWLGRQAMAEVVPSLARDDWELREQDHAQATYFRKRSRADGLIRPELSLTDALNLVRALDHPYPGAEVELEGLGLATVWRARAASPPAAPAAARWLREGGSLWLRQADGWMRCDEYDLA